MIPPVERKAAPTLAEEGSIVITRSRSAVAAVGGALNFTAASSGAGTVSKVLAAYPFLDKAVQHQLPYRAGPDGLDLHRHFPAVASPPESAPPERPVCGPPPQRRLHPALQSRRRSHDAARRRITSMAMSEQKSLQRGQYSDGRGILNQ